MTKNYGSIYGFYLRRSWRQNRKIEINALSLNKVVIALFQGYSKHVKYN